VAENEKHLTQENKMADIPTHHLIYGTCTDYLTGNQVIDTDDERFRQKIARFLVEELSWPKDAIESRRTIDTLFAGNFVQSTIDFVVRHNGKRFMIIRYGPGSLVTRQRPAIAAARVLDPDYRIPVAVVTNGKDAVVLSTADGKVLGEGLDAIPSPRQAAKLAQTLGFEPFPEEKRERELRILNACDKEICCIGDPCPIPGAPEG